MASTSVRTVTIDCSLERGETLEGFLAKVERQYGLKTGVVTRQGPAGGAPVVELKGSTPDLARALTKEWDFSPDETAEFIGAVGSQGSEGDNLGAPAATEEWLRRFKPRENVWNHYTQFKTKTITMDKLPAFLNEVAQGHELLYGGEPAEVVTPAVDGFEVIQVTHIGGRDWVVILGNVGP